MTLREWALPVYTILMQLATGAIFILWVIRGLKPSRLPGASLDRILRRPVLVVFLTILFAVIGSHFHLSSPLLSFLAILNFRHSWLSREILFTILMFLTCAALLDQIWKPGGKYAAFVSGLGWTTVLFGCAAVFSMACIYLLPTQASWNHWSTILIFFCTSLVVGITSATALLVMDAVFTRQHEQDLAEDRLLILKRSFKWLVGLAAGAFLAVVFINVLLIVNSDRSSTLTQVSLSLLLELYRPLLAVRFLMLFAGVGIFAYSGDQLLKDRKSLVDLVIPIYLACLFSIIAEILGRFLFYASHIRLGI